jgi:peptidoglycan/xylan/chitin deacetylase (PgdA/CDA1 family)
MAKRVFNLMVSLAVGIADWLLDGACRVFDVRRRPRCMVLGYHAVNAEEREHFARQMDVVARYAKPVPCDVQSLPAEGGRFAAITFDDGIENIIDNALPELKKRGIPATLFIVTETLGKGRAWEHLGGEDTRNQMVMSEDQLRRLPSELITIGSHSMTHPQLPKVDHRQLNEEVLGSRLKLEKMLNREVKLFSFPYGASNEKVIEACREAGYGRVFTALPVFAFGEPSEFISGRVGTHPLDWPLEFRLKLAGAYRWLPYAYSLKRRVRSLGRSGATKSLPLKEQKRVA